MMDRQWMLDREKRLDRQWMLDREKRLAREKRLDREMRREMRRNHIIRLALISIWAVSMVLITVWGYW